MFIRVSPAVPLYFCLMPGEVKMNTLQFPDTFRLVKFLVENEVSGVETNSRDCTVTGEISMEKIIIALTKYYAYLQDDVDDKLEWIKEVCINWLERGWGDDRCIKTLHCQFYLRFI